VQLTTVVEKEVMVKVVVVAVVALGVAHFARFHRALVKFWFSAVQGQGGDEDGLSKLLVELQVHLQAVAPDRLIHGSFRVIVRHLQEWIFAEIN
jgi:hypothetical protein